MADKLLYIPNDNTQNYPFCILQLVFKTFGHLTKWTNQSNFNRSPQDWEQAILRLWGLKWLTAQLTAILFQLKVQ